MIRIERPKVEDALDAPAREHLKERASSAATLAPGSSKITSRWDSFRQGDGEDKEHGPNVCKAIRKYCCYKCVYCESFDPQTIDHFWPKTKYPAKMFNWDNLLAACRDCNSDKRTEFRLDKDQNALLIDPTCDEPLAHFRWDAKTGKCKYPETNVRAAETARKIKMDRFAAERSDKLGLVRFFLARCIREKPIPDDLRERLRRELDVSRSYLCILRSYFLYPDHETERVLVRRAIQAVPEILDWVRPWLHPPEGVAWPP